VAADDRRREDSKSIVSASGIWIPDLALSHLARSLSSGGPLRWRQSGMTIRARHIVMSKGSATQVTIDRDFQSALSALQAGKPGDAVRLFEAVLRVEPEHVGALNLLGVVLTQLGALPKPKVICAGPCNTPRLPT
jgi:hypothetical protein